MAVAFVVVVVEVMWVYCCGVVVVVICFRCCCRLQSFTYLTNGYRLSIREGDNYFTPREDNAFSTDRSSTDRCGLDHLVPDLSL